MLVMAMRDHAHAKAPFLLAAEGDRPGLLEADEALAIGLVDVVVPAAEVYPAALALAAKFAKGPALALAAAKAAIDGGLDVDLGNGLRLESHLFASLFATEDRATGMKSFIEDGPGKAKFNQ